MSAGGNGEPGAAPDIVISTVALAVALMVRLRNSYSSAQSDNVRDAVMVEPQ